MSVDSPPRSFVDTNIFVYALAGDDARQPVAAQLVDTLLAEDSLATSVQVMQELYAVLTRKARQTFSPARALQYLEFVGRFATPSDYALVREAAILSSQQTLSIWDALIVVSAARAGAEVLYTEGLQHGRTILGVGIVNPFR